VLVHSGTHKNKTMKAQFLKVELKCN